MSLKTMLKTLSEARGLTHQMALRGLRLYLNSNPDTKLIEEISKINDRILLKFLWEAGLNSELQLAAITKWNDLKGIE